MACLIAVAGVPGRSLASPYHALWPQSATGAVNKTITRR